MYITITIELSGKRHKVSVDERQCVSAVFGVLRERGLVQAKAEPGLYRSALLGTWIGAYRTFKEQNIVSGDFLAASPKA